MARWAADLSALGAAAPRRVLQEAALRTGWEGRRYLHQTAAAAALHPLPLLDPPGPVPDEAVARAGATADVLLGGTTTVFGRPVPLDPQLRPVGSWHTCPDSGVEWPSHRYWWQIDVRGPRRAGDVKWVWEAARHRDLVTLARAASPAAAAVDPDGATAAAAGLAAALDGWCAEVHPERGVHWLSNLEIALRALAWLQVLALAGGALPEGTADRTRSTLGRAASHLELGLARTSTSMANNHLVGDLVALAVLDLSCSPEATTTRFDVPLVAQVDAEVRADGSMIEESTSYHRFVLELLALRVAAGHAPAPIADALARGAAWLCRLGALDGGVPQFGDWDEGRAVVSTQDGHDLSGTSRLALSLAGTGARPEWRRDHDEVAWHAPEGEPYTTPPVELDGHDVGGGFARAARGAWTTWLKASGGGWHGHADHTSVVIRRGAATVVGDPGTGTYNGPLEQRQHHRSSVAHNVLRVDGEDQLGPHRQFRWRRSAASTTGPPLALAGGVAMWAAHDAYRQGGAGPRVVRVVWCSPEGVVVADWTSVASSWALSLPVHPTAQRVGSALHLDGGDEVELRLPGSATSRSGQESPYDGWWSPTYGQAEAAERLEVTGPASQGPIAWQVAEVGAPEALVRDDGGVEIGTIRLRLRIGPDGAHLHLGTAEDPDAHVATLLWP